jgi:IrrE N-terminal-like domain
MTDARKKKNSIIKELRALVPIRPLTLSESYTLAEEQASRALRLVGVAKPAVDLGWVVELPRVSVELGPRYKMSGFSGATTFTDGRYLVLVSKNDGHVRRRFTLAHELKHILDWTAAPVIHRHLGYGDTAKQSLHIELICNHFAACLLMPKDWLHNAWTNGIQETTALAGLFMVSDEAMDKRLRFLGYRDDEARPIRSYFRLNTFSPSPEWLVAEETERRYGTTPAAER